MRCARWPTLLCILFLTAFAMAPAYGRSGIEQDKIDYLIAAIAGLHDARFVRNGSEYDAQRAVSHLRLKLRYAGDRVATAEDFIVDCATSSSFSGRPYQIKFADGHTLAAAAFLRAKLAAYKAPEPDAPPGAGD